MELIQGIIAFFVSPDQDVFDIGAVPMKHQTTTNGCVTLDTGKSVQKQVRASFQTYLSLEQIHMK